MNNGRPVSKKCEKCGKVVRNLHFCKIEGVKMYVCNRCVVKYGGYYPSCSLSRSRSKMVKEMKNGN